MSEEIAYWLRLHGLYIYAYFHAIVVSDFLPCVKPFIVFNEWMPLTVIMACTDSTYIYLAYNQVKSI